jgi:hypothetical protein
MGRCTNDRHSQREALPKKATLADYGISAEQPDEFLVGLVDINERLVAQARREQWMALKRPPLTKAQFSILSAPQPRPEVAAIRDLIY